MLKRSNARQQQQLRPAGAEARAAAALAAFALGKSAELSCGECTAIQESIYRSIRHNLTDLEQKAMAGTTMTKTIEIGQIIWHVCELSLIHI